MLSYGGGSSSGRMRHDGSILGMDSVSIVDELETVGGLTRVRDDSVYSSSRKGVLNGVDGRDSDLAKCGLVSWEGAPKADILLALERS